MKYAEYDATIDYPEGSIASFDGINKAYLKNPLNSFKMEWAKIPSLNDLKEIKQNEKPSLIGMLIEFNKVYGKNPDELAQQFMIKQYEVEFDHWSRNN